MPQGVERHPLIQRRGRRRRGQARLSWRVVIGWAGSRPGNSQPMGRALRHQVRSSSNSTGDSMT